MCRNNAHGGRRCPHNDSDSRRLRRKNADVMAGIKAASDHLKSENEKPVAPFKETLTVSEIKEKAAELKDRLYAPVPDGMTQEEYDKENEVLVTSLGLSIAAEAERISEYDPADIERKIQILEDATYKPSSEKINELQTLQQEVQNKYFSELDTIVDEEGKPIYGLFMRPADYIALPASEQKDNVKTEATEFIRVTKLLDEAVAHHRSLDKNFDLTQDAIKLDAARNLKDAYKNVIEQIRPVGGDIEFNNDNKGSVSYAVDLVKSTVGKDYPKEWIEYSNNHETAKTFVIATDDLRPNYSDEKGYAYAFSVNDLNEDELKGLENKISSSDDVHDVSIQHPFDPTNITRLKYVRTREEAYDPATHGDLVDGKPVGEGWVYKQSFSAASKDAFSSPTATTQDVLKKYDTNKYWVKNNSEEDTISTLKVFSKESVDFLSERSKVSPEKYADAFAYHEFAHRMEAVFPDNMLARQEKAFLSRRTGKNSSNWNENLVNLPEPGEYAHANGGFVNNYVAREYFGQEHYEVFSVGIESLYGGTNGGLIGSKQGTRKDTDHRGFVLGCLATL